MGILSLDLLTMAWYSYKTKEFISCISHEDRIGLMYDNIIDSGTRGSWRVQTRRKRKYWLAAYLFPNVSFDKTVCFFCEGKGNAKQPLHNVSKFSAGKPLNEAIILSGYDVLWVKRSTSVDATDAHAVDIKYECIMLSYIRPIRSS